MFSANLLCNLLVKLLHHYQTYEPVYVSVTFCITAEEL